jgi:hypothetical protein
MPDIISEYQHWKQQGQHLRQQAKSAMELRFRELMNEAIQLCDEYRSDFGGSLKPPPSVTAFRYKSQKGKPKPAGKGKTPAPEPVAAPKSVPAAKPDPKVTALEKKLAAARKKLEAAKTAGTPTKALEDKVYEIEDDLRLAMAK